MQETKSNWDIVAQKVRDTKEILLDTEPLSLLGKDPDIVLLYLNAYKFAAKLIGSGKRVLDIGCNGGFGTYLLGQECGTAIGIDTNEDNISSANCNFSDSKTSFQCRDFLSFQTNEPFSAITFFNKENSLEIGKLFEKCQELLSQSGLLFFNYSSSQHQREELLLRIRRDEQPQQMFIFSITGQTVSMQYDKFANSHIACCIF